MVRPRNLAPENNGPPLIGRVYEVEALREGSRTMEGLLPWAAEEAAAHSEPTPSWATAATGLENTEIEPQCGAELPFVGRILDYVPNESILVERWLVLEEDLHLADHAFVNAAGVKPLSACLPVVPMTLSLEMLAETAACLAPGWGLIGFEDVKATRWIELANTDRLRLKITARVLEIDGQDEFCRILAAIQVEGQASPAIQANVLFASHYRLDLSLSFTELANPRVHPMDAEKIYADRYLFHGPVYQCLTGQIVLGDLGAVGELSVKAPTEFFRSTRQPQLLTDPALLDAVGQLIGIWAMEQERYVFPIGIQKLELYRPPPPPGTKVPVRIEITRNEGKTLDCDVEIQDGAGGVWMRIKDWKDWKFRWERRLVDFRRIPTRYLLSQQVGLPRLAPTAVCCAISPDDLSGFDARLLACFYLHVEEMQAFSDKQAHPRRQLHWLLGRIAAKDAVRSWLARRQGTREMLHPAAFVLRNDEKGRPEVAPGSMIPKELPNISISHCEDRAIAVAHDKPVGVDIETVGVHDPGFVRTISSEKECALLKESDGEFAGHSDEWITRLWCAKEAAGKLLGKGLNGSPRSYALKAVGPDGLMHVLHGDSGRVIEVHTLRDHKCVIAYCEFGPMEFSQGPMFTGLEPNCPESE
ncbi:MAG TPA: polyketide synthase dehydratase domain-containing protein [Methylococcus sp.]|nr:polyketide synthase dehydratase domain-containing protein [Methylococcus sp.]